MQGTERGDGFRGHGMMGANQSDQLTREPISANRRAQPWASWQRSEDYYNEGLLVWLDADTLIREMSGGKKSLDDFARAFFGIEDGRWTPVTYTFDDIVKTLNGVQPYDWAKFLRARLTRERWTALKSLPLKKDGDFVRIAGLVLVRQRPGTASGVIFMTLEDETGISNLIVWPKTFERFRKTVLGARVVAARREITYVDCAAGAEQ